ncbi:hypothetical protein NMS_0515 [Nonlabens marinus S1-08]|uniref:Uncharacterized protein n=1 Tax=Nonlabens marinus S1-08 TaxID=1454201 RepID=W8VNL0_9FLAO|nr:hypothetical protein NMS_0515 [Nonlabens marinus S1-08]
MVSVEKKAIRIRKYFMKEGSIKGVCKIKESDLIQAACYEYIVRFSIKKASRKLAFK